VKGVGEIEGRQLVWVKRDGTARPIDPEWTGIFRTVALSPDGTRLAVSITGDAGQDLWVKQLERGPASRLTFTDGLDRRPTWMPDGQSVMFQSERGDNRDLYMTHADGRGSAELVLDLAGHVDQGLWSASGDWLIYRTGITGGEGRDIFAWRSGPDSATVPVATAPGIDEHSPALSPDGKWLAYVSNETGRWEVYVRPVPNVETARWQVSVQGGTEPVWAHSGRELFFRSDLAQMVADAVTTPTFSPGPPRALFSLQGYATQPVHALYDVSADDQRFVMIRLASHTQGRGLILVENFFEELKARVGN
jgi:serine/threonine-protein kinase